jgi:PAS domain S-box-containing protein
LSTVRELPELFDRGVKARSLAFVFAAGATLGLLTLAFPHSAQVMEVQLLVLAVIALAVAAVVFVRAEAVVEWQLHAVVAIGTLLITLANYWGGTDALYPLMYCWTALYAFYFFRLRAALAHLALIGVAYAVVLAAQDAPSPIVRWLLAVGTPWVAGLVISRMLGLLRRQAAQAGAQAREVSESEARTRLILESAHDAFVAIDRDGTVTAWNAMAARTFGWTASEALGRPVRELIFAPEDRDAHDARRERLLQDAELTNFRYEVECQRRDGERFPAEFAVSRLTSGDEPFLSAFIRDVSDRERQAREREALLREQAARAEAERFAEIVSGMQVMVDAAIAHRTLAEILDDLVGRVRAVFDAEAVTIFDVDEAAETLVVGASSVGARNDEAAGTLALGEAFAGRVASERRPLLVHDPADGEVVDPKLRELGLGSLMGAPLLAEGDVTGVIQVGAVGKRFTDEDLGMLRLAADRVALAVHHARVYEREHRIAVTLQRSLLPERLPQLPGLAVAARYHPAATEAEVGGDWYDVIPIPGGGVGLVMGDVAGKGLAAASMVGRLRSALRAYALEGHDPSTVVRRLNQLVWAELEESQMATLLYVVVDPSDGTLRWVNSGHMPPLLVSEDGPPRFLEGGRAVPLGVMPFPSFEEVSVGIEPAATVVLFTDGLVERPGEHIDDGLARLASGVSEAPGSPDALCDHLLASMVPSGGAPDDVAILALRNTPMSDRFSVELPTRPETLASMRGLMRRWLRHVGGSEQEIAEITAACGEAATNAIEHAGAGSGSPFEVEVAFAAPDVDVVVRDYGAWRPRRDGEDQGRGLSLMRALMDEVDVTPTPEGTTVRLRRALTGEEPR